MKMSADSPRRVTRKGNAGHTVLPQPVNDPSLIDSVTGFIQEVVPQAYSGSAVDSREQITWARVQQADANDPALFPDVGEQDGVPPLLLVLGYGSGVQQALCAPSRNSFLTSRRPDSLHLYDFYSYWRDFAGNFTTLPQYFKEHGYFTKSIGKVFHPGISSNYSDDQPYSWSEPAYHPPTEAFKEAPVCGGRRALVCPVTPCLQPGGTLPDLQSTHEARSFLRKRRLQSQPFLLAVGFHKPHVPLKYPRTYLKHHPLDNVTLPLNTWPVGLPSVAWNPWTDVRARDDISAINITFPFGRMPDEWTRLIRQSYYAAVTYIDDLIGQLLQELKSTGLYNNTIIALIGDHGWSLGEHGEWSKFSNYEAATRVPLIVRVPGFTEAARRRAVPAPVELLDLFPTLAESAGLPSPPPCPDRSAHVALCTQGTSLVPAMFAAAVKNKTVRDIGKPALSQYPRPGAFPTSQPNSDKPRLAQIRFMGYTLRTARFRYSEWPQWEGRGARPDWDWLAGAELYDHWLDPGENENLADRQAMRDTRAELSRQLRARVGRKGCAKAQTIKELVRNEAKPRPWT